MIAARGRGRGPPDCGLRTTDREISVNYTARMLPSFFDSIVELITRTSTDLPPDVRAAMRTAAGHRGRRPRAPDRRSTIIAQNIDQAASCEGPICQDTGMPTFEVKVPVGANQIWMKQQIREAIAEATRRGKLRPNSVDSITGENSGDNLGPGTPIVHFEQWERAGHRGEADPQGRRLREHQRAVLAARPSSITSAAPIARSKASASASCTRSGRRRARAAARAPSASASAAIAPPAICTRRSSCSARSTTPTPIHGWPRSRPPSWTRPTGSASGRWASAGGPR